MNNIPIFSVATEVRGESDRKDSNKITARGMCTGVQLSTPWNSIHPVMLQLNDI